MSWFELTFMMVGFALASYAIVGNDAIQTLGTFLASNGRRPWWVLWAYAGGILAAVLLFGWSTSPQHTATVPETIALSAGELPAEITTERWTDVDWSTRQPWDRFDEGTLTGAHPAPTTLKLAKGSEGDLDFLQGATLLLRPPRGEPVVLARADAPEQGATTLTLQPTEAQVLPAIRSGEADLVLQLRGTPPDAAVALTIVPALEAEVPFFSRLGDVSYGRLQKYPLPDPFTWVFVVPPLVLLVLTRFGLPVSTTFLILTIFQAKNLQAMLTKSLIGYAVALMVGIVLYLAVTRIMEKRFIDTADRTPPVAWVLLQWCSTAFLWAMWLIQDLANIFVYLPRGLGLGEVLAAVALMLAVQAYIFYTAGGEIQKIVTSKTNTQDIRSATIIDFLFGIILLIFKEASNMPMSTTWVFLGLLAGREVALNVHLNLRSWRDLGGVIGGDALKAAAGLVVSVIIALTLPPVADWLTETATPDPATAAPLNAPEGGDGPRSP